VTPEPLTTWIRACPQLFAVSLRRAFWSRQTLVGLGLTLLVCLITLAWAQHREPTAERLAEHVLIPTFVAFLMPVLAICYGSSMLGGEREEGTLIYLLIVPIPRPLVYLTKAAATLVLVWCWSAGVLTVICTLAGKAGWEVFGIFLPACTGGAVAYALLFMLLSALFRHGTIVALGYWFFLEVLLGNMPGIIKRISVAFYVRSMIYDAGADLGIGPRGRVAREMYLPVTGETAAWVLAVAAIALLVIGPTVFSRREYRDLS